MISSAFAQATAAAGATPPTDWTALLVIIGVIVVIVGGLVYYEKIYKPAHPTATTPAIATSLGADWNALVSRVAALEGKVVAAVTPAAPVAPAAPAGKHGVAGVFTITVTGNQATDIPAIMAQYLA